MPQVNFHFHARCPCNNIVGDVASNVAGCKTLPSSVCSPPPRRSRTIFIPPRFTKSFSTSSGCPASHSSSSPGDNTRSSTTTLAVDRDLTRHGHSVITHYARRTGQTNGGLLFNVAASLTLRSMPVPTSYSLSSTGLRAMSDIGDGQFHAHRTPLRARV